MGAIPFLEYHSVHSAPEYSRMNRMEGIWFTRNRQNTSSFGKFWTGNPTWPPCSLTLNCVCRHGSSQVTSAMGIPFPDRVAFFGKLKFRVFCYP